MEQVWRFLPNFPPKYNDPYKCNGPLESSNPFALQKPKVTPGATIQGLRYLEVIDLEVRGQVLASYQDLDTAGRCNTCQAPSHWTRNTKNLPGRTPKPINCFNRDKPNYCNEKWMGGGGGKTIAKNLGGHGPPGSSAYELLLRICGFEVTTGRASILSKPYPPPLQLSQLSLQTPCTAYIQLSWFTMCMI
jgi:hypothetical protein